MDWLGEAGVTASYRKAVVVQIFDKIAKGVWCECVCVGGGGQGIIT